MGRLLTFTQGFLIFIFFANCLSSSKLKQFRSSGSSAYVWSCAKKERSPQGCSEISSILTEDGPASTFGCSKREAGGGFGFIASCKSISWKMRSMTSCSSCLIAWCSVVFGFEETQSISSIAVTLSPSSCWYRSELRRCHFPGLRRQRRVSRYLAGSTCTKGVGKKQMIGRHVIRGFNTHKEVSSIDQYSRFQTGEEGALQI